MMTISSPAGRRLAKAKARYDQLYAERGGQYPMNDELCQSAMELTEAGDAVADELIAAGFADMEGDT